MRRHWSESHGVSDPRQGFARTADLQTFVRGTKTKYFEVKPQNAVTESDSMSEDALFEEACHGDFKIDFPAIQDHSRKAIGSRPREYEIPAPLYDQNKSNASLVGTEIHTPVAD